MAKKTALPHAPVALLCERSGMPTWGRLAVAMPRVEVLADHSTVPLEVPDGE